MGIPIPIMAGIYTTGDPVIGVRYPLNLVPVPGQEGVADGYLRPAEGIVPLGTGLGTDRAAIVWTGAGNNVHYRVSGTKLISVSSTGIAAVIGDVGGSGHARLDFSHDRLGILSGGKLFFWDNVSLIQVTDPNIPANLIDMRWLDGYWVVTDGVSIAVSDLATPTTFNPSKFGTTDRPDPVKSLQVSVANELTVVSTNFIDVFQNIGGAGFPFRRVSSAVIKKGAVGTGAACIFSNAVAFVGGGQNESPSIYLGRNAQTIRIGTTETDRLLSTYTSTQLATITMDAVFDQGAQLVFVHLPDRTAVYDAIASAKSEQPMWHIRTSGLSEFGQYRARNMVRANDAWVVGDPQTGALGTWSLTDSQHYGLPSRWEFSTLMLRKPGTGATMNSIELLGLTGSVAFGTDPRITTAYSKNGRTFSQERPIRSGQTGDTDKRLIWFRQGTWKKFRVQRFRGDSSSRISPMSLDADITALKW